MKHALHFTPLNRMPAWLLQKLCVSAKILWDTLQELCQPLSLLQKLHKVFDGRSGDAAVIVISQVAVYCRVDCRGSPVSDENVNNNHCRPTVRTWGVRVCCAKSPRQCLPGA